MENLCCGSEAFDWWVWIFIGLCESKVEKFLGKGSYGSVYRVKRLSDGLVYAVKELDVSKMSQVEKMDAVNEIRLLASIKHPNVVGADHRQALCLKLSPCGLSQIFHQASEEILQTSIHLYFFYKYLFCWIRLRKCSSQCVERNSTANPLWWGRHGPSYLD